MRQLFLTPESCVDFGQRSNLPTLALLCLPPVTLQRTAGDWSLELFTPLTLRKAQLSGTGCWSPGGWGPKMRNVWCTCAASSPRGDRPLSPAFSHSDGHQHRTGRAGLAAGSRGWGKWQGKDLGWLKAEGQWETGVERWVEELRKEQEKLEVSPLGGGWEVTQRAF